MPRNISVTLGEHIVNKKIEDDRLGSTGEADKINLSLLRETLAVGEAEIDSGDVVDGAKFMEELI